MSGSQRIGGEGAGQDSAGQDSAGQDSAGQDSSSQQGEHTAGAFDVRSVIAGLIGLFGVVLVVVGLVSNSAADLEKTGGVNANLWSGLAMVGVALGFVLWVWLRPIVLEGGSPASGA